MVIFTWVIKMNLNIAKKRQPTPTPSKEENNCNPVFSPLLGDIANGVAGG
jgi:hypothetical protein